MKHLNECDCYCRILDIIGNLNNDKQKLNAIKHLIYNQFETFIPSLCGNEHKKRINYVFQ